MSGELIQGESYTSMDREDPTLIGTHCQFSACNQLDFLPFRCESCRHTFCLEHRMEEKHHCTRMGEWAARKRLADLNTTSVTANARIPGKTLSDVQKEGPCSDPKCKTIIGTSLMPGVHCPTCNRGYCLKHRLQEDHDCKNLVPIGAKVGNGSKQGEKALAAIEKLRAWGIAQKASLSGSRLLPKAKPSSTAARVAATTSLKKKAKGDPKVPLDKRLYLYVEAEKATTKSQAYKSELYFSQDWVIGRVLDAAAKELQVENVNNQSMDEVDKLRVFHVEGGRVLEFSEKVGQCLQSGNTIVLLRGVGPAIPDLIDMA